MKPGFSGDDKERSTALLRSRGSAMDKRREKYIFKQLMNKKPKRADFQLPPELKMKPGFSGDDKERSTALLRSRGSAMDKRREKYIIQELMKEKNKRADFQLPPELKMKPDFSGDDKERSTALLQSQGSAMDKRREKYIFQQLMKKKPKKADFQLCPELKMKPGFSGDDKERSTALLRSRGSAMDKRREKYIFQQLMKKKPKRADFQLPPELKMKPDFSGDDKERSTALLRSL